MGPVFLQEPSTHRWPKMSSGIMTPSILCISTGIPRPLLNTEIWFFCRSIVTLMVSIDSSLVCSVNDARLMPPIANRTLCLLH